jgi:hypothetical protein
MSHPTFRAFTHDELEELGLDWKASGEPIIQSEAHDKRRWYTIVRIIFEHDGAFWRIDRMDPATEMQEGQDIWSSDPVVAVRVEPYSVTITKYRPVTS